MVQGLGELMGVRFDAEQPCTIYLQTAGHPYVTRQLCSRLVKFFPERPLDVRLDMILLSPSTSISRRAETISPEF